MRTSARLPVRASVARPTDLTPGVAPLRAQDVETLRALADLIWQRHYPPIIGQAQTDYMLAQRYSAPVIAAELASGQVWWRKLELAGAMIGFSSCVLTDAPGEMKLDKIYVHPEHQRRGYGALLIRDAEELAREHDCGTLILAVNKNNRSAIAAYEKHGFRVRAAVVKPIGGGFVMDDFVMAKRVRGEA